MLIFTGICGIAIGVLAGELFFNANCYSPRQQFSIMVTGIFIVAMAILANIL